MMNVTLHGDTPAARRRSVLDTLVRIVPGEFACFFGLSISDDGYQVDDVVGVGDAGAIRVWEAEHGKSFHASFDPMRPGPRSGTFDTHMNDNLYFDSHYRQFGLESQARMLAYDDQDRFAGWLGVVRRADHPLSRQELRKLNRAARRMHGLVVLESQLRSPEPFRDALAVLRSDGTVESASRNVRDLLTRDLRARLCDLVRGYGDVPISITTQGTGIRLVRLDLGDVERFAVQFYRPRPVRLAPDHTLTERQRDLAARACSGATARELAAELGISTQTVRKHLQNIYLRLGVRSRVEMVRLLGGDS